jgi:hypothetical protein
MWRALRRPAARNFAGDTSRGGRSRIFEKNQTVARGLESMPLTGSVPELPDKASEKSEK